jgi:hypothetical protein
MSLQYSWKYLGTKGYDSVPLKGSRVRMQFPSGLLLGRRAHLPFSSRKGLTIHLTTLSKNILIPILLTSSVSALPLLLHRQGPGHVLSKCTWMVPDIGDICLLFCGPSAPNRIILDYPAACVHCSSWFDFRCYLLIPTVEDEDMASYITQAHFSSLHLLRTGIAHFYGCIDVNYLSNCDYVFF